MVLHSLPIGKVLFAVNIHCLFTLKFTIMKTLTFAILTMLSIASCSTRHYNKLVVQSLATGEIIEASIKDFQTPYVNTGDTIAVAAGGGLTSRFLALHKHSNDAGYIPFIVLETKYETKP
jgi:hypothetical protein